MYNVHLQRSVIEVDSSIGSTFYGGNGDNTPEFTFQHLPDSCKTVGDK